MPGFFFRGSFFVMLTTFSFQYFYGSSNKQQYLNFVFFIPLFCVPFLFLLLFSFECRWNIRKLSQGTYGVRSAEFSSFQPAAWCRCSCGRVRARAQGVLLEVLVLMPDFCFDGSCFDLFLFHIKHEDGFFFRACVGGGDDVRDEINSVSLWSSERSSCRMLHSKPGHTVLVCVSPHSTCPWPWVG